MVAAVEDWWITYVFCNTTYLGLRAIVIVLWRRLTRDKRWDY